MGFVQNDQKKMKVFLSTHFGSLISEWLVLAVAPVLRRANSLSVCPFGVHTFVQVHEYRVLSLQLSVKHTLHVTMSPQWLFDMSSSAVLGSQLNRFKPFDILTVEEHVANDGRSLVDFERMTAQYNPLAHHPVGVDSVQRAYGQQLVRVYTRGTKTKGISTSFGPKETREAVLWFLAGEKLGGGGGRECDAM
jgi:hypothetical protein